jgi:pyruvate dehydrogenase E2 component (dihydrolipoamide acetyltransferase)
MSTQQFVLPDVGEGLTEAEIVTWKVNVGDTVTLNQPLIDIETAKATVELPSPFAGVVTKLHGAVGDVVEVGKPLIDIEMAGSAGAASAAARPASDSAPSAAAEVPVRTAVLVGYGVSDDTGTPTRQHRRRGSSAPSSPPPAPVAPSSSRTTNVSSLAPRSTPPVRLYAKQHGVDLGSLVGTGRDGLITRADVEHALAPASGARVASSPTTSTRFVGHDLASWDSGPKEERIAVRGVLRSMAEAMVHSAFTAPHAAAWVRFDATRSMELLSSLKSRDSLQGVRITPLTLVAMALCDAARHYPGINSQFDDEHAEVVVRRSVNLGIAADTPRGLIVPNIKAADTLGLVAMANALSVLVEKARAGTTTPNEMLGTTLTITNVGPFGIDGAMPILPPGTSAILAVGQIAKAPWVVDDEVVVRQVMEIALAFDHRLIDGALASHVLRHVADFLSDPAGALIAG